MTTGLPAALRAVRIYALRRQLAVRVALAVASQLEALQLTSPICTPSPGSALVRIGEDLYGNTTFRYQ